MALVVEGRDSGRGGDEESLKVIESSDSSNFEFSSSIVGGWLCAGGALGTRLAAAGVLVGPSRRFAWLACSMLINRCVGRGVPSRVL